MKSPIDENKLVGSVLSKDRAAFEQLVHQYEGLVLHIVSPMIRSYADKEDICQDVFLKVYERLHTFRFRSKLSTWIGHIAYNTALNFLEKRKILLTEDIIASPDDHDNVAYQKYLAGHGTSSPEQSLIKQEEKNMMNMAVEHLPVIQKSILLLFHQDELSLEEISQIMNVPVNTVKSHLFRARKRLKEILLPTIKGNA